MHMSRAMPATVMLGCLLLAGCSAPEPPTEERRPQPQAQRKPTVVETAHAYEDSARASVAASEAAAKREQAALDAATQ